MRRLYNLQASARVYAAALRMDRLRIVLLYVGNELLAQVKRHYIPLMALQWDNHRLGYFKWHLSPLAFLVRLLFSTTIRVSLSLIHGSCLLSEQC